MPAPPTFAPPPHDDDDIPPRRMSMDEIDHAHGAVDDNDANHPPPAPPAPSAAAFPPPGGNPFPPPTNNAFPPPGGNPFPPPGGNPFPFQVSKDMLFPAGGDYMPEEAKLTPTYTQSWNLSLQREVTPGTLVSASYIGKIGRAHV